MLEPPDDLPCQRPIVDNDAAIENVSIRSYRSGKGEVFRRMLLNGPEFAPVRTALNDSGYPSVLPRSGALVLAMLHQGSIVNVDQAEPQPLSTMYST